MANHVRQQLREAVAAVVTGLSTTGARVFQSRVYPLQSTNLPCLVVTTDGDNVEYLTENFPAIQQRETTIRIEAYEKRNDSLDDTLDTICKEVETAIANSSIDDITIAGTRIDMDSGGDQPIGRATMIYKAGVQTFENAPDTIL